MRIHLLLIIAVCLLMTASIARISRAQDSFDFDAYPIETSSDADYEMDVSDYEIQATDQGTGFAETVQVADGSKKATQVSDVLSHSGGVQVRSLGGPGAASFVSIRGSSNKQVPIYLDGVLLNTGGFSAVNIGNLRLENLESIEIYRGTTPPQLATAGMGGAILLKTRILEQPAAELGTSFGTWNSGRIYTLWAVPIKKMQLLGIYNFSSSDGAYRYLNRNGTRNNDSDDQLMVRENNRYHDHNALLKISGHKGKSNWSIANIFYTKQQGLPGLADVPTQYAALKTIRNSIAAHFETNNARRIHLSGDATYMAMAEQFSDRHNEIGVGHQQLKSRADATSLGISPSINWNDRHTTYSRIDSRFERFSSHDQLQNIQSGSKYRLISNANLSHQWDPTSKLMLMPTVRLAIHNNRFKGGQGPAGVPVLTADQSDDVYVTPAAGIRYVPLKGLSFRANAGQYVRPPDINELFGDRGNAVGNQDLKPESGINLDAGFSLDSYRLPHNTNVRLQSAFFASRTKDLIVTVANSQNTIRPENIDEAHIWGVESTVSINLFSFLSLLANYTFLHGENRSPMPYHNGKKIPGKPAHELYTKMALSDTYHAFKRTIWFDAEFAGETFFDQANLKDKAASRILLGAGFQLTHPQSGVTVTVEANNLFNRFAVTNPAGHIVPIQDLEGFPLPGRAIFVSLHWRTP